MNPWVLAALISVPAPAFAAKAKGVDAAQADLRRGLDLYMSAKFDDAVEALTEALAKNPRSKTAAGLRSICLWTTGDVAGARRDAQAAMSLKPSDAETFAARGFARFVRRDLDGAAHDFIAAAKRDKRYALAYYGMGSVRSSQERLKDALTNLNLAARFRSDSAAVYIVRGTVLEKLKSHRRAVDDYSKALRIAPEFRWAYFYRGRAWRELQEWRKAIPDLNAFLEFHPDFEQALYFRSNALFAAGDYKGAVKDLDRILQLNPKNSLALANRGVAKAELGDRDAGLADLRKAKALAPEKRASIEVQIARIESGEAMAAITPAADADVEITGTPGKGLAGKAAGELSEDAGIAAQPDLPTQEPLPEEEAEPAAGASLLPKVQTKPAKKLPEVGPAAEEPEDAGPDAMNLPTEPPKEKPRPPRKPVIQEDEASSPAAGPGEFMFLR